MMAKAKMKPKAEILKAVDEKKLDAMALQLHTEAVHEVNTVKHSITRLGGILTKLKDPQWKLWRRIKIKGHKDGFKTWEEYAQSLLGPISHGKIHEMVAAHSLTQGENAIPAADVEKMGVKRANEVARLEPQERTPDIVEAAKTQPVAIVKQKVQEKINLKLPEDERKETTIFMGRNLTPLVVAKIEEIEEVGCFMEGIRDGNMSVSLRDKLWLAVWTNFEANFAQELKEARRYMEAEKAKNAKKAKAAQEDADPEDENGTQVIPPGPDGEVDGLTVH